MQEAQRAAKAANKQVAGPKQKDTSAIKEEPKKMLLAKIQTSGSNIPKCEFVSVTGKPLLLLNVFYHGLCGSNKLLYKRCVFSMGQGKF